MIKPCNVLILSIIHWSISCLSQCQFDFPNYNVSFDLSPLIVQSGDYEIPHSALTEWTFYINFCARAVTSSSSCNSQSAYAFTKYNSNCYKASASNGGPPTASLLTTQDPSFGIILQYTQGEWCSSGSKYRSISLHLMCDPNVTNIETAKTAYFEDQNSGQCTAKISPIHTPYACPIACHSDQNGELCNNHGECGYDHSLGTAKCFCFHGYAGSVCAQSTTANTITDPFGPIDTSSKYVHGFYDSKVVYNLSWFSIDATTFPQGRTGFIDLLDPGRYDYYWSAFDYPVDTSACSNGNADDSYFYQIDGGTGCFSLGASYNVQLYDTYNPVKGLTIQYSNGDPDWCPYWPGVNERDRSIEMTLICADFNFKETKNSIDLNTGIYEIDQCVYAATLFDIGVCPYQCITHSNNEIRLCSSHGICSFDKVVGFVRCLCNQGYTGDFCEFTKAPTNHPAANPTTTPTSNPSQNPTKAPTKIPTATPSSNPAAVPTYSPTKIPTKTPSTIPTMTPSSNPTMTPTLNPSVSPSSDPSMTPSSNPTSIPSFNPSKFPTPAPTSNPIIPGSPTASPTLIPSKMPTTIPSRTPSKIPTNSPTECDARGIEIEIEFQYELSKVVNSTETQIGMILLELVHKAIASKNLTNNVPSQDFNISVNEYYNSDEYYEITIKAIVFVCGNEAREILVISIENTLENDFVDVVNDKTILFITDDDIIHIQIDAIDQDPIDKNVDTESTPILTRSNERDDLEADNNIDPLFMNIMFAASGFLLCCCILFIVVIIVKRMKRKQQAQKSVATVFTNVGSTTFNSSDDFTFKGAGTISMSSMPNKEGLANTFTMEPGSPRMKLEGNTGSNLNTVSNSNSNWNTNWNANFHPEVTTHDLTMSPSPTEIDVDLMEDNGHVMTPKGNEVNNNVEEDEFIVTGDDDVDAYNIQNVTKGRHWNENKNVDGEIIMTPNALMNVADSNLKSESGADDDDILHDIDMMTIQ